MFCLKSNNRLMIRLAAATALAVVASMPVHAAEPVVKTARWVTSDPSIPHDTFAYRSITLKGTSSMAGQNIRATWDFGDNTDPASFTVMNGYDVSARHVYYATPGTVFTARLTVVDSETGESGSATYLVAMREKTLDSEVNVAIDEGLWYLHKRMQQDSASAANLLAFERNGHLESGDSADPYTEIVARGLKALRQVKSPTPDAAAALAAATNQKNPNATTTTLPATTVSQSSRDRQGAVSDISDLLQILQLTDRAAQLPDWYSAEVTKGDPADGIARTLVNRQQDDGSWTGHSSDPALETSASLRVLNASPSVNVISSSVTNVSSKVSVTSTSFQLVRLTNTYNGTMTVTNTSGSTITGPLSVGLPNLTGGVTLSSPMSATFNGAPYIALTGTDMNAGQAISVLLKFSNPAKGPIVFIPTTYSGTMPPSALTVTCPANTATTGTPYSSAYTGSGGVLPYTFSTPAGMLPHNLTLDPVTGAVTGTPDTVENPTFTAKVTDSAGGTPETASDATCHINVTSSNQAPTAVAQSTSTNEDIAKLITLTGTDPDGNALTFAIVTPPSNGMLGAIGSPNCVGNPSTCTASVTYTPNANTSGSDSFTFKVNDGTVDSSPATVGITINFVNDVPSFTKGADQSANKGAAAQTVSGWATNISPGPGSNEAGQTVNFVITGNTTPGIFSVAPAVSPTGTLTYTPSASTTGTSTITLVIHDNGGVANGGVDTSAPQSFTITTNDPPKITSANSTTFAPGKTGQSFTVTTTGFPTGASMVIGETGTLPTGVMFTDNGNGTATISGTPAAGTQGSSPYALTLSANNGVPPPDSQNFTLNITCPAINVTSAPTAGNLSLVFNSAMATNTYSQTNGNGITGWTITGQPAGLSIGAANGQLTGTPTQTGTFSATVTFTDAGACTGTKAVTIAVKPVAVNDAYTGLVDNTQFVVTGGATGMPATPFVSTGGAVTFRLTNNDLPSGNVTLTTGTFATSAGGSVTIAADGTFIYTPKANPTLAAITADSFTYTISSDTGATGTPTTAQGTANLTLAGRVWYVLNNLTLTGNGQSQNPFKTLSEAIAASTSNDNIFVYRGDGTTTNLATASVLKTGQSLIGQGVALVVNGNTLVAAGSTPLIGNTVTLNTSTTARGFNLSTGSSTGMNDPAGAITSVTVNTVSVTTTTGTGVNLSDITGTLSFTGLTTNGGAGATLTGSNSGATFTFTGVSVISAANTGFNATGGGTVTVTGTGNTITSTTGTALSVANTTIGAGGMTFQSISSNGAPNGISLVNTGSGAFTVAGNGGACDAGTPTCTGGRIQNTTGADFNSPAPANTSEPGVGVYLNNVQNVSLNKMHLNDNSNFALYGTNVTTFTMDTSLIDGSNGTNSATPVNDGSVTFLGLFGTSSITNSTIKGGFQRNVNITNSSGTANLTISNNTIRDTNTGVSGDDNLFIQADTTATVTAHVTGNTFAATNGDHLQVNTLNSATMTIVATGNFYSAGGGANQLLGGITLSGGNAGSTEHVNFNISNNGSSGNPLVGDIGGGAININQGSGGGTWQGQVAGNWIGNPGVANSGSTSSAGIRVENHSVSGTMKAIVGGPTAAEGNHVRQTNSGPMINFQVGDTGNVNAAIDLTVMNNDVNTPGAASQHGILGNFGADTAGTNAVCVDTKTNTVNLGAVPPNGGADIRLRQRNSSTVRLPGYGGANTDTAAVITFESGQNTLTPAGNVTASSAVPPGGGFVGGGACSQPTVPN